MNKKLIVNQNLNWPSLNESESMKIVDLIETQFKAYQSVIRRVKTPPKYIRNKKLKSAETPIDENNKSEEKMLGIMIKKRFRLGINAVTKTLENEAKIVKFVLVCQSCIPLKLLTRHLHIMCSYLNVPAGCCFNLSKSLAKFFNVKTVSSLAICDESLLNKDDSSKKFEKENILVTQLVDELSDKIKKLLKPLENPLTSNIGVSKELIETTKLLNLDENKVISTNVEVDMKNESSSSEYEKVEEFGSDFISIGNVSKKETISFDSNNFILFNDDYETTNESFDTFNLSDKNVFMDRNKKRKLNAPSYPISKNQNNLNNFKFNKLKLMNKKENKSRNKAKNDK